MPERGAEALPGINSLQLFWNGQQWSIVSILFDFEDATAPLPDVYLQNTGQIQAS